MTRSALEQLEMPAVERQLAVDMARRGIVVAPIAIAVAWAVWGTHGAVSAAFGIGLALANLLLAAVLVSWAARVSTAALAAASLGGYVVRLALLTVVVLAVRHQAWVSWIPFSVTLLVTHLGLLIVETRHVSATLAFPGLAPAARPRAQKGR